MAGVVDGLNAADFIAQIRLAMGIGQTDPAPLFHFAVTQASLSPMDGAGVPFDATAIVAGTEVAPVSVPCAIAYLDSAGAVTHLGDLSSPHITVTLLGDDYALVKGFSAVEVAGIRYRYRRTALPEFLGSVSVWNVHCLSEGQS
jgi:hypothetical protein